VIYTKIAEAETCAVNGCQEPVVVTRVHYRDVTSLTVNGILAPSQKNLCRLHAQTGR
jgi:hypothetical protein